MKIWSKNSALKIWLPRGETFPINLESVLRRLLGVTLGGLFIWAGFQKLFFSFDFVKGVLAYRLLPGDLVGIVAAGLPWVELVVGLLLVAGIKRRSCLLLLELLLGVFMVIMVITIARGLKIDCGCGLFQSREVGLGTILEDAFFLAWTGGLYWWELSAAAGGKTKPRR